MAGKSAGKSRLSGKRGGDRSAKRHKQEVQQHGSILQFLRPPVPRADATSRDSSSEPEEYGQPSQTPAVHLLAGIAPPASNAPTAVGARQVQPTLLRSLQHRFATQQALDTPADWGAGRSSQLQQQAGEGRAQQQQQQQMSGAGAAAGLGTGGDYGATEEDDEEEEEDGFQLFSQLAYEPTFLSQRPPEVGSDAGPDPLGTSQLASQTQVPPGGGGGGLRCSQHGAAAAAALGSDDAAGAPDDDHTGGLDWPAGSQQQLTQPQQSQQEEAHRRASGVHTGHQKTTPALQSAERVRCNAAGLSGQKMFPLFRRRDATKTLYIVRHGESAYNAAMARGSSWADPLIFDAQLTDKGKQQACALQKDLLELNLPADTLWLTSPLQRAMQTLLLGCPHSHLLGKGADGGASGSGSLENSYLAPNCAGSSGDGKAPAAMVLPCITEKLVTSGDIGHPASDLCKWYPQLEGQLAAVPELWWHSPHAKPNCAVQKRFGSSENKEQLMVRIGAFRRWLQNRPEQVIVAVGHSAYWRAFQEVCQGTKPQHMHNCEIRLINF